MCAAMMMDLEVGFLILILAVIDFPTVTLGKMTFSDSRLTHLVLVFSTDEGGAGSWRRVQV